MSLNAKRDHLEVLTHSISISPSTLIRWPQLGNDKSKLKVYNLSTGQCFCEFGLYGAVTAIAMDSQGTTLFAGDAKGYVHSFGFDQRTNKLLKQTYTTVSKGKAITSLQYKAWFSSNQMPELLANCQDNTIKLFKYAMSMSLAGWLARRSILTR